MPNKKIKYYARPNKIKVAAIMKGTTLKQLAEDVSTNYNALVMIAGRKNATSKLRAQVIANSLDVKFEDLFEAVEQ